MPRETFLSQAIKAEREKRRTHGLLSITRGRKCQNKIDIAASGSPLASLGNLEAREFSFSFFGGGMSGFYP
jgi:hypothetical protein